MAKVKLPVTRTMHSQLRHESFEAPLSRACVVQLVRTAVKGSLMAEQPTKPAQSRWTGTAHVAAFVLALSL